MQATNVDSVVVVSGGFDSVTLLHFVVKRMERRPLALSFDYGQRHATELDMAKWNARELGVPHEVIRLDFMKTMSTASSLFANSSMEVPDLDEVRGDPQPSTYVPNRNMIFAAIAAGIAEARGAEIVYLGVQAHDMYGYWDTTPLFMQALNSVLMLNRKSELMFSAPFAEMSKTQILRAGTSVGVNYAHTWSCYRGGADPCGTCATCRERLHAFAELGMIDPLMPGVTEGSK